MHHVKEGIARLYVAYLELGDVLDADAWAEEDLELLVKTSKHSAVKEAVRAWHDGRRGEVYRLTGV